MKFSVANINGGTVRTEFMSSILELYNEENRRQHTYDPLVQRARFSTFRAESSHGPYLDDGRNLCSIWFLNNTDDDYLLFIDSDVVMRSPSQAFDLIESMDLHGVTVCSGVYYSNSIHPCRPGIGALIFEWGDNPNFHDESGNVAKDLIPLADIHISAFHPQSKPHPIDSSGAGFLAIHRSVFTDMIAANRANDPTPFFAKQVIGGIAMGEDHVFNLRANSLGHTPHVLPSIELDHLKTCIIRPNRGQ